MTRGFFIDYALHNKPLGYVVVVHLAIDMPPSGRMVPRVEVQALPLPFAPVERALLPELLLWLLIWGQMLMELHQMGLHKCLTSRSTAPVADALRRYTNMWNAIDVLALTFLSVWVMSRILWWYAMLSWAPIHTATEGHGTDVNTVEYLGFFQPLASLLLAQKGLLAIGIILAYFRLPHALQLVPFIGPLLRAFFKTLLHKKVVSFALIFNAGALVFSLGSPACKKRQAKVANTSNMCMCMCMQTHMCMHMCMHAHVHVHVHAHVHAHAHVVPKYGAGRTSPWYTNCIVMACRLPRGFRQRGL